MPSFDIVSELDKHELVNAVDQANREVATRYDFKGTDSKFTLNDKEITLQTEADFQLQQMLEMLKMKMSKRGIDLKHLEYGEPVIQLKSAVQKIKVKEGIDKETGKKIVKLIKDAQLKVQASIQGEQVRVTGKKRDDLQATMVFLREANVGLPLQFNNFRD
ncbi:MAG TPA: YajQ family cyclic di-GMP-binding protein [Coxiellaceae bacterium]|nr:YajQ family cyclic di-GMP-binding protein [Coxiellaceae bacterium]